MCLFVCIDVCAGGEGKVGKVVDIRGWDTESGRSVASVTWSNGTTNVYRMGHKGKVDLKYVSDGQGGFYYKDHLPKLGKTDRCLFQSMHFLHFDYMFGGVFDIFKHYNDVNMTHVDTHVDFNPHTVAGVCFEKAS